MKKSESEKHLKLKQEKLEKRLEERRAMCECTNIPTGEILVCEECRSKMIKFIHLPAPAIVTASQMRSIEILLRNGEHLDKKEHDKKNNKKYLIEDSQEAIFHNILLAKQKDIMDIWNCFHDNLEISQEQCKIAAQQLLSIRTTIEKCIENLADPQNPAYGFN